MKITLMASAIAAALIMTASAASAGGGYKHNRHVRQHVGQHHYATHQRLRHHRVRRHHARSYVYGSYTKNELVRKDVLVRKTRYVSVPVRYKLIATKIMVRPARRIAHRVPAVRRTIAETVMIRPARRVWTYYTDRYGRLIGCWRDKPARYAVRHRTVTVRPGGVYYSTVPAEYRTITRSVRAH